MNPALRRLVLVTLLVFTGCGREREEIAAPIVVGAVLPLSGPESERGMQVLAGLKLAFSLEPEIPTIEVRAFDIEESSALAARRLESLALDDQVVAVVTGWSASIARSVSADPRRADLPVILLSPVAFPRFDPLDSRLFPLHRLESLGIAAAHFAREDLRADRAALFEDARFESSRLLAESFRVAFERLGGRVVWSLHPGDALPAHDPKTPNPNPPALFSAGPPALLDTAAEKGPLEVSALLFAEGWAPPTNDLPSFPGVPGYVVSFGSEGDSSTPAREFRAACERAGLRPTGAVAFGWDAARLLGMTFQKGSHTRESVLSSLQSLSVFEGATGRILLGVPADSSETPAVSSLTPSGWAFRRRVTARGA